MSDMKYWKYYDKLPLMQSLKDEGYTCREISIQMRNQFDATITHQDVSLYLDSDENRERRLKRRAELARGYRKKHKEKNDAGAKRWREENKVKSTMLRRTYNFCRKVGVERQFTGEMVQDKLKDEQFGVCYLTGESIDWDSLHHNLDHKIPSSKGGSGSLSNCGITTPQANSAKANLTLEELEEFAIKFLTYNRGYKVTKNDNSK
jgi:5-methylcytosine-specific restriction endonuclease McrA